MLIKSTIARMLCRCLLAYLAIGATSLLAQETPLRAGRLSKADQAALVPGLGLQFFTDAEAKQPADARIARVAALHVPNGTPPSPFVPAGPFTAKLQGYLKVPLKGEHTLRLYGTGEADLLVEGQEVLALIGGDKPSSHSTKVALVKGYNRLEVRYRAPANGDATLRIYWSGSDFVEEPLPPDALFTLGNEKLLVESSQQRLGRELVGTRSCRQCHELGDQFTRLPGDAMPELAFQAPSLAGVGSRLSEAWIAAWILEPKKLRPTATMPQLLHGEGVENAQAAADIAAYLATLTTKTEVAADPDTTDTALVEQGLKFFEDLGCVGCHHTQPSEHADPFARRSLHYAKAKFNPGEFARFLQKPTQHYAWSRMPDFKLGSEEAAALTAYLQSKVTGEIPTEQDAPQGSAERGAKLFATTGCAHCHATQDKTSPQGKTLGTLANNVTERGCLSAKSAAPGKSPQFNFSDEQRSALTSFLATDRASLLRETKSEYAQRRIAAYNCAACHRRDGTNSVLSSVLQEEGEQGLAPEILPALSWSGEKLKPAWTKQLFAGELPQRSRHWLRARMPSFPLAAEQLSTGLSHQHGFVIDENPQPQPDPAQAEIGEQLVGERGLSCVKCHAIGKRPPLQPFEAPGINLVDAATRLRYGYYPRWMMDPPRVDVATKMPKFSADGRTTGVTTIHAGDAARQYESLWHYIQSLK